AGLEASGEAYVFCSGSQITDDWVVTAAHCIEGSRDVAGYGLTLAVLYGDDILGAGYTDSVPWLEGYANPAYNSGLITDDSGLVQMAEKRPDIDWMVLNDAILDDTWIGTELTFYGFGITADGLQNQGTKRTTKIPITGLDGSVVETYLPGTNVCNGDSGGPSTFEGPKGPEQVGINSWVSPGCVGGSAGSARIDTQLGFILGFVPNAALDYNQLPQDGPKGDPGAGGDRDFLDLGVSPDVPGLGGEWAEQSGGAAHGACSHGPGGGVAWIALAALFRRGNLRREAR
ncbi:MAG: trypsin-like serine protease, partial [Myxococcota bacterium]